MNMSNQNAFLQFHALGYKRFCPIVPPDAKIYERSTLNRQLGKSKDPRGKTPGLKNRSGEWYGFDFVQYESGETDLHRWHEMGAGVGLKTGAGLVLIDADTTNEEWARIIRDEIATIIPLTSVRVGQYPKAGYVVRTDPDFKYTMFGFGGRDEKNQFTERVEILSEGKQFVAHGIHQKTRKPYEWPKGIPAYDDLPFVSGDDLRALLQRLAQKLPAAGPLSSEGAVGDVNQDSLKGKLEDVRKAVRATPNTAENFPTREDYRNYGYAIKAALQDHAQEAFELFEEWCEGWVGPNGEVNEEDMIASDWRRMKPPFRVGASKLFELAEKHSGGTFSIAEVWFPDLPDEEENPFTQIELNASKDEAPSIKATLYDFPDPGSIPPRQWLYGSHYIRQFVSATVAPSGVGKSSLEIVEALVMASGKPLLGIAPKGQFRVWLWNGEDPRDELARRISAAMLHYGLTREDIGDRLFVDSGRDTEIVLATETRNGVSISAPVVEAVLRQLRANKIDVLQIDPFVSSHRVSENDNGAIDLVTKQWAKIADAGNCSVELVHHVRKLNGAEITVEDSRGASALLATSRSARAITRMSKGEGTRLGLENLAKRLFRFGDGKNNLALPADDRTEWFELRSVPLGNGAGSGVDGLIGGDSVGVVTRFEVPAESALGVVDDEREMALRIVRGGEWRRDIRAGEAWIGVAIAQAMRLDAQDAEDKARINAIVSAWIKDGTLVEVTKKDAKRRQKTFVEAAGMPDNLSEEGSNLASSVFD